MRALHTACVIQNTIDLNSFPLLIFIATIFTILQNDKDTEKTARSLVSLRFVGTNNSGDHDRTSET